MTGLVDSEISKKWSAVKVVFGGVLVHLSLGTIYTFGNLSPYLTSYLRHTGVSPHLTYTECSWTFALALMGQGTAMCLGGVVERHLGVRLTTLLGCWFMSLGVLLTYLTVQHSFELTVLTYGLMSGLGLGFAYAVPLSCAMQWLPKRKGLASGIIVAGFGGGAFVFDQVQTAFINPTNLKPGLEIDNERYFTDAAMMDRVPAMFLILGGCYAIIQLVGSLMLSAPSVPVVDQESGKRISQPVYYGIIIGDIENVKPQPLDNRIIGESENIKSQPLANGIIGESENIKSQPLANGIIGESGNVKTQPLANGIIGESGNVKTQPLANGIIGESGNVKTQPLVNGSTVGSEKVKTQPVVTSEPDDVKKQAYLENGHILKPTTNESVEEYKDYSPKEMLKSKYFYMLFFMFLLMGQGNLFVATLYKAFGQTFISDDSFLSMVGTFAAVFNGFGRIAWGCFSDKYSFHTASVLMTSLFTCLILTFELTRLGGKPLFFIYVCLLVGCLSGCYSLFPTATAKCFGKKYLSINYGLVFSNQIITAPIGVLSAHHLMSLIGWSGLFFVVAGCTFCSFLIAIAFNAKDQNGKRI